MEKQTKAKSHGPLFWIITILVVYAYHLHTLEKAGKALTTSSMLQGPLVIAILLFSVIIHESAHALTAYWAGDSTAKDAGRLTLNPFAHISLWGSIIFPMILLVTKASFVFGWAKPVPTDVMRLRHPRRDAVLMALAGPASNFLLACLGGIALAAIALINPTAAAHAFSWELVNPKYHWGSGLEFVGWVLATTVLLNLVLGVFNLLPIPPLDGSWLLRMLLPGKGQRTMNKASAWVISLMLLFLVFSIVMAVVRVISGHF